MSEGLDALKALEARVHRNNQKKTETDPEVKKSSKGKKKPKATRKRKNSKYKMDNGTVDEDKIFLYTPENTIPKSQVNRFLEMCDEMIKLLGPKEVNTAEIEEIARVYREIVMLDTVYSRWIEDNDSIDTSTLNALDKMIKAVEKRKENLAIISSKNQKDRNLSKKISLVDIVAEIGPKLEEMEMQSRLKLDKESKKLTDTKKFMEDKVGTSNDLNKNKQS